MSALCDCEGDQLVVRTIQRLNLGRSRLFDELSLAFQGTKTSLSGKAVGCPLNQAHMDQLTAWPKQNLEGC